MNKIYKDMYTTENIEAIGGIDNMNRWVKEMQKNDMRIKRNKFLDSVFTLVLDAALIYGIVILTMRIFLYGFCGKIVDDELINIGGTKKYDTKPVQSMSMYFR